VETCQTAVRNIMRRGGGGEGRRPGGLEREAREAAMGKRLAWAVGLAAMLGACEVATEEPGDGQPGGFLDDLRQGALTVDHEAVVRFQADWSEHLDDGPIFAGGRLRLDDDPNRLPWCRATYNGLPAWSITARWKASPGDVVRETPLSRNGSRMQAVLQVPEDATSLEIWFVNSDRQGCRQVDSDFGANYRFETTLPSPPVDLVFGPDWSESAAATLRQGGIARIVYAPQRLTACRATDDGARAWNILASWRFSPGGQTGSVALFQGDFYTGEGAIRQPLVPIPADATSVSFWFSNSDRTGCQAWDSDYGRNYTFPIAAKDAATRVGWAGDFDFVWFHRDPAWHRGDVDPAWYFDSMGGAEVATWMEVQVWAPGITDRTYGSDGEARTAAESMLRAEAVTDAVPGPVGGFGTVPLVFQRRQGNNFVYAFQFVPLRRNVPRDGLYRYYVRFSADQGSSWFEAGRDGERMRRFVLARTQDCSLFPDHPPEGCPVARTVDWAGDLGRISGHDCAYSMGVPDPVTFYKSGLGHDCMVLTVDVYVAGLTDAGGNPEAIRAEVETDVGFSGGPLKTPVRYPLGFQGKENHNYRFAWWVQEHVGRADRGDYRYRFRVSADDGKTWYVVGRQSGPADTTWRTLRIRNDSQDGGEVSVCDGVWRFEGATSVFPACIDYETPPSYDARYCEFWPNALGRGSLSHNGASASWIEAWIRIGPVEGTPRNVGIWVRARGDGGLTESFVLGKEVEPGYWFTGYTYARTTPGQAAFTQTVEAFAFFLDVQRPDGRVDRLWQSRQGSNWTVDENFLEPGSVKGIGVGQIEYCVESAPVLGPKHACNP